LAQAGLIDKLFERFGQHLEAEGYIARGDDCVGVCGGTSVPGAAGQRVRGGSLASRIGWCRPARGRMRFPSIALGRP
jgi:hypothetical protein